MDIDKAREAVETIHRLGGDYEVARWLLDDIISTFRLPANRTAIARDLPQLVPIIDSWIGRYARHFEDK